MQYKLNWELENNKNNVRQAMKRGQKGRRTSQGVSYVGANKTQQRWSGTALDKCPVESEAWNVVAWTPFEAPQDLPRAWLHVNERLQANFACLGCWALITMMHFEAVYMTSCQCLYRLLLPPKKSLSTEKRRIFVTPALRLTALRKQ